MPRLSEISRRNSMGLIPMARLTAKQRAFIKANEIPHDSEETYFGRRCFYWNVDELNKKIQRQK